MNKAPTINATLKLTAEEWKGQREKEMISILGSWDRSVSQKILIIQLSESNENYSFFYVPFSSVYLCLSCSRLFSQLFLFLFCFMCSFFCLFFRSLALWIHFFFCIDLWICVRVCFFFLHCCYLIFSFYFVVLFFAVRSLLDSAFVPLCFV